MAEGFDGQERTEDPTPKKRAKAREDGQIARSADLSGSVVLLAGAALLAGGVGGALGNLSQGVLHDSLGALSLVDLSGEGTVGLVRRTGGAMMAAALPFTGGLVALAVLAGFLQTRGLVLSTGPVTPRLSHLDPFAGTKRLVSLESLVTVLKSLVKLLLLGGITWLLVRDMLPGLLMLPEAGVADIAALMLGLAARFGIVLGLSYIVLGAADWFWQHHRTEQKLKMSRQEVQNESRESEGNPHVKARIVAMGRALVRRRMLQKVPTADVVIVNPTHVAVALKYDPLRSPAPIVLAMGQRKLAERIRDIATRAGVPLVENRPVARALLATASVGRPIPPALYAAVAEILAFVFRRRKTAGVSRPVRGAEPGARFAGGSGNATPPAAPRTDRLETDGGRS